MIKKLLPIFALLFCLQSQGQKSPDMINYFYHLPFLNGAAVAKNSSLNAAVAGRYQWVGFDRAPFMQVLNVNLPISQNYNYLGFDVYNTQQGITRNTRIGVNYTFRAPFELDGFLAFSVTPEVNIWSEDQSLIQTDFGNDPLYSYTGQNFVLPNARFATFLQYQAFYFGLSTPALFDQSYNAKEGRAGFRLKPNEMQWNAYAATDLALSSSIEAHPSVVVRMAGGAPLQVHLNAYFQYLREFGFGLSYHSLQNLNFHVDYHWEQMIKIGYSFTHNLGQLGGQFASGSHEAILVYGIKNRARSKINLERLIKKKKRLIGRKKLLDGRDKGIRKRKLKPTFTQSKKSLKRKERQAKKDEKKKDRQPYQQ
jgi:type IX secretion system PorP/SprF family membrane protein